MAMFSFFPPEIVTWNAKKFLADRIINIPEGQSGPFRLIHKILPEGSMLSMPYGAIKFDGDVWIHVLTEKQISGKELVWMSDTPREIVSLGPLAKDARGNILIAGLGLGYVATKCLENPEVESVTVVEYNPHVIKLVYKHLDPRIKVIQDDFHHFVRTNRKCRKYDFAILDIWPTISDENVDDYAKLISRMRRHCGFKGETRGWAIDESVDMLMRNIDVRDCQSWKEIISTMKENSKAYAQYFKEMQFKGTYLYTKKEALREGQSSEEAVAEAVRETKNFHPEEYFLEYLDDGNFVFEF